MNRAVEIWAKGVRFRTISVWTDESAVYDIEFNWGDVHGTGYEVERWLQVFGRSGLLGLTMHEQWSRGLTKEEAKQKVEKLRGNATRAGMRKV